MIPFAILHHQLPLVANRFYLRHLHVVGFVTVIRGLPTFAASPVAMSLEVSLAAGALHCALLEIATALIVAQPQSVAAKVENAVFQRLEF